MLTVLSENVRAEAINILTRMNEIVRNDMLIRGQYVTGLTRPDLAEKGSVCGGHNACAIGSMWIAAGMVHRNASGNIIDAINYTSEFRHRAFEDNPALELAFDAMNEAAERFAKLHFDLVPFNTPGEVHTQFGRIGKGVDVDELDSMFIDQNGAMEALFEADWIDGYDENYVMDDVVNQMPKIIRNAKDAIRRAPLKS